MLGANRTYDGHHETDANDPKETSNGKVGYPGQYGEDTRCSVVLTINCPSDFGRG
jgi:hypothetical protein